ncbi:MAG: hypothetical protein NC203_12300 [Firmicutes bacterium]|nr:hypothetical protein [[Eubacterium] siraeum]MCM1489135.1 hypothetical protein [Bacillota bacterium]
MDNKHKVLKKCAAPIGKIGDFGKKYGIILFILVLLPVSVCSYALWGILAAVLLDVILSIVFWFFKLYDCGTCCSAASLAVSAMLTAFSVYGICEGDIKSFVYTNGINDILFLICLLLTVFYVFNTLLSLANRYLAGGSLGFSAAGRLTVSAAAFLTTAEIYLPLDTFVNNIGEFNFAVQDFIFLPVVKSLFFLFVAFYLGLILKAGAVHALSSLLLGLTVAAYAQYTFMNGNLGLVIGLEEETDVTFGIINVAVWIILLILPFAAGIIFKKHRERIVAYAGSFITAVQLLSAILITLFSQENVYGYRNSLMPDGRVQYDVAAGKNIVTFIFDAADNAYFKQLLEESPEVFEGLEDFTLYTNTCSKYCYTFASINQMLTGTEENVRGNDGKWAADAWQSDKAQGFYQRLHQAGYTVNGFVDDSTDWELMSGCCDNTDYNMEPAYINRFRLGKDMEKLCFYRYAPVFLKKTANIANVNCNGNVIYENRFRFYNDDYFGGLHLTKREDWENCFLIQHLFGTHPPCDDTVAEAKNCLSIVKEYIRQLKELGLYENSVIIVTADHGRFDYDSRDGIGSTPVFMIKEAGNDFDEMKLSSAPEYHTDFLSTCLVNAELYSDGDAEIYGSSIYDFEEGDERERTWYYNTMDGERNNYNLGFSYIGDDRELGRVFAQYDQ